MNTQTSTEIEKWISRRTSLSNHIEELQEFFEEAETYLDKLLLAVKKQPSQLILLNHFKKVINNLKSLVSNLSRYYISDVFNCFTDDIGNNLKKIDYVASDGAYYYFGYILNTILRQVGTDLYLVQEVFDQRRYYCSHNEQVKTLYYADRIGEYALRPAIQAGYLKADTMVVTHIQQQIETRIIPYHNTVLLAIPFWIYSDDPFYYLALPHEMGHYFYWHGTAPNQEKQVYEMLQQNLIAQGLQHHDWRWHWLEELFADLYGCLIAGPINVLYFQELLIDSSPEVFCGDIDTHPIPELRPLIQTQMLRLISKIYDLPFSVSMADQLDTHWLTRKQIPDDILEEFFRINTPSKSIKIAGQEIINQLNEVIQTILETLSDMKPYLKPWSYDNSAPLETLDDVVLTKQFEHFAWKKIFVIKDSDTLEDNNETKSEIIDSSAEFIQRIETVVQEFRNTPKQSQSMPIDKWLDIIFVNGWSIKEAQTPGNG